MTAARVLEHPTAKTARLRIMPNDQDPREAVTLAPATDREPADVGKTQPPTAADAPTRVDAIPPPAPLPPEASPEAASDAQTIEQLARENLVRMHQRVIAGLDELLGPSGRLEQQTAAIAAVVDRVSERFAGSFELLAGELKAFRKSSEARDADQERRIGALETTIGHLKEALGKLERDLQDLKNGPARPTTAASPAEPA